MDDQIPTEDGEDFINNLAYFVRSHEKALANSIEWQRQRRLKSQARPLSSNAAGMASNSPPNARRPSTAPSPVSASPSSPASLFGLWPGTMKPARLFLTPNQLYYLLCRFQELDVHIGPLNIRLENMSGRPTSSGYVSFISHPPVPKRRSLDQESMRSVSSVRSSFSRSFMSILSSLSLGTSPEAKAERKSLAAKQELTYLYSAFTKIPCVKFSVDQRIRRIKGYEEFPLDTAAPFHVFKNLTSLEIEDVDYRSVYGWDRLADQLQSLTLRRAGLNDTTDLLNSVVLDDQEERRRRSSKVPNSPGWAVVDPFNFAEPTPAPRKSESPLTTEPRSSSYGSTSAVDASDSDASRSPVKQEIYAGNPSYPKDDRRGQHRKTTSASSRPFKSDSHANIALFRVKTPSKSRVNTLHSAVLSNTKWRFLRHLSLPENRLATFGETLYLQPLSNTLKSLDLSSNPLTDVPDLSCLSSLRAVNLSNCMIESLQSLRTNRMPAVTVLNLQENRLSSLEGLEQLTSLERLDLRKNMLIDPMEIGRVTGAPNIFQIYVKGNPFVKTHEGYRVTIFHIFRSLSGFVEDVMIDSSLPRSNELRSLDRRAKKTPGENHFGSRTGEDGAPSALRTKDSVGETINSDPSLKLNRGDQKSISQYANSNVNGKAQNHRMMDAILA